MEIMGFDRPNRCGRPQPTKVYNAAKDTEIFGDPRVGVAQSREDFGGGFQQFFVEIDWVFPGYAANLSG